MDQSSSPSSSASAVYWSRRLLDAMGRLDQVCVERSLRRTNELAERLDEAIARYRSRPAMEPGLFPAQAPVSMALDRFVAEARTSGDLLSGDGVKVNLDALDGLLRALNQVFVASEEALAVGTLQPSSFMSGAEVLVHETRRQLHDLAAQHARDTSVMAGATEPLFAAEQSASSVGRRPRDTALV